MGLEISMWEKKRLPLSLRSNALAVTITAAPYDLKCEKWTLNAVTKLSNV